jgi:hypothetical protein
VGFRPALGRPFPNAWISLAPDVTLTASNRSALLPLLDQGSMAADAIIVKGRHERQAVVLFLEFVAFRAGLGFTGPDIFSFSVPDLVDVMALFAVGIYFVMLLMIERDGWPLKLFENISMCNDYGLLLSSDPGG